MPSTENAPELAYRDLLANRNFTLIWVGQVLSSIGDGLHMVALPWLVLEMTGSTTSIGVVMAGYMLAVPIFGLMGGAVADRWHRKRIMIVSLTASAGFVALIPVLFTASVLDIVLLTGISFLLSTATQFFEPALNAAIPGMVSKQALTPANSMIMSTKQLGTILGPGLAGFLITQIGITTIFYIDALTFVMAAMVTLMVTVPNPAGESSEPDGKQASDAVRPLYRALWADIAKALSFVRRETILFLVILLAIFANLAVAPIRVITPSFVQDVLGQGAESYGFLISAFSVGVVLAMLLVGRLEQHVRKGSLILAGFFTAGVALGGTALVTQYAQLLPLFFIVGCGFAAINVPFRTLIQVSTPDELLGKVLSLDLVLSTSAVPLSQVLFGLLAEQVDLRWTFVLAGGILLACTAIGFLRGELRHTR